MHLIKITTFLLFYSGINEYPDIPYTFRYMLKPDQSAMNMGCINQYMYVSFCSEWYRHF